MTLRSGFVRCGLLLAMLAVGFQGTLASAGVLSKLSPEPGIAVVLGLDADGAGELVDRAAKGERTVYFQTANVDEAKAVRLAADKAGVLGSRIFVDSGSLSVIHLADNLADQILVAESTVSQVPTEELLRVLIPRSTATLGDRQLLKPVPSGIDDWTHPYHGPDNNPQSNDKLVRGDLRTQFLAYPKFSPMPEQSVVAGGRIFKAMGHIAHKANQNPWLNTLICINAYNGTILWQRPLPKGFMIHRNTMIATDDALYLGDDKSCQVIDARTGKTREHLTVSEEITDGPVWKWMAMRDGVLYALVGNPEIKVDTQKSVRRGLGHWPWDMWKGHDYKDPRTSFGFGRTIVAIDLSTKKLLWHYRDDEFLDARGVCMNGNQIFCASPEKFLLSIDIESGKRLWKNTDEDLLEAIGKNHKAQLYVTGYSTSNYVKCNEDHIFLVGPQRLKMVAASTADGHLEWTHKHGNLQVVLRPDAIYAAGPTTTGVRLDYASGKVLGQLPTRRACTRATGCADSIFYRTSGGTMRVMTESNHAEHISPMRPPCQDGVIVSNGHLYWGPWMCGCQLSLYGHICLSPADDLVATAPDLYDDALTVHGELNNLQQLDTRTGDWPVYRGSNSRADVTATAIPEGVELAWETKITTGKLPTAPVTAGGLVFVADRNGIVRAINADGATVWKQFTSGPIYYPPAVVGDRLFVGSADGRVYAYEASTGRPLWTFRVAPEDRWISVYGDLISTWPVSGGIVVHDNIVYAAAGIAHYDGTFLVGLDAATGKLKLRNSTSGNLAEKVNSGISMQGNLMIVDGELRFLAGGVYEVARYSLSTLECLNQPKERLTSQFRTAFYPFYPAYGKFVSVDRTNADGTTLVHDASYEGSIFQNLVLLKALPPGTPKTPKEISRWNRRGANLKAPGNVWRDGKNRRFTSFMVGPNALLSAAHSDKTPDDAQLVAINMKNGADIWTVSLPADSVKGGTAIDHQGRIYVALENGTLRCYVPKES